MSVALRTSTGVVAHIPLGTTAQRNAIALGYVLRNRRRWADRESTRAEQAEQTRELCEKEFGLDHRALSALSQAGVVEVEVPFTAEPIGWEGRVMPWEYVISAATRKLRFDRPVTVCRRLRRSGDTPRGLRPPERLLFVETAPCDLRTDYTFDYERKLVHEGLGGDIEVRLLKDPTRDELAEAVRELEPDVVHVTGFDNHQGLTLIGRGDDPDRRDGILLRASDGGADAVAEQESARLLTSGGTKPLLVALNLYNSAGRTAALAVAEGADAAIGFQDEFEDPLAESFFASLYLAWREQKWDLHAAFKKAMDAMRAEPEGLQGTGIVLWTSYSKFDKPVAVSSPRRARARGRASGARAAAAAPEAPPVATTGAVEVKVDPLTELNYSMLHNKLPKQPALFDVFLLRNFTPSVPHRVSVKVTLFVGNESYPCEKYFTLTEPVKDLSTEIHVPLISAVSRTVRESLRTSLFVEVTCDDVIRYRQTHPVTLLPIDEWRDDTENRHWLPSFVLPRDPAVPRIVESAQRYLMALRDDPSAGFDGYQSWNDGSSDDPGEPIDLQVQALWSAMLYELPLSYINPPPTYTASSQRVRSPSDVTDGKRGTCIDLALLVAACLEYVEIYPVIILLKGHAFPGYWRSEQAHRDFRRVVAPEAVVRGEAAALREVTAGQAYAWFFEESCYREVVDAVRRNDLVLLETVYLTQRAGFWDAVDEGAKNLRNRSEFEAMIDVVLARRSNVTPLPMIWGSARFV